ncbi:MULTISPECIES: helix-turn-helix domain-containing protein [Butyrivibrio]|jgi:ribosome-binding protein aMBF1 (putative translation factor)|uniref:helix-turn-helix domain-containing protein n=1 Tax=Butyrivibrio TaxID=830 RepID=UPI0003F905B6|nr:MULTISPECIES: helix-turn-helix transcriptional regulator [Butyrivibrio]SEP72797.1 Helix-turn-helix [Butyrivibrio sp. TB]
MGQFKTWNEVREELYTPEEIAESNLRVALMGEIIAARKEQGISQRDLEKITGIKQPVIARIESGQSSPRIDTLVKLLAPLGKTIAVVPLKQ